MSNDQNVYIEAVEEGEPVKPTGVIPVEVEYRVVCASYGTPGHHEHSFVKPTVELAKRFRDKKDIEAKGNPRTAVVEIPHRIEQRNIAVWVALEE